MDANGDFLQIKQTLAQFNILSSTKLTNSTLLH